MSEVIKSFEEATTNEFGDILSKRRVQRPTVVGLLTCGYFEYWRMYPNTLKAGVQQDMNKVEAHFKEIFGADNVVLSGLVDTLDSAEIAGKRFAEANVDVLVVVEGTYLPDFISLHAINHVKNAPVIFFSTQMKETVDINGDYEHSLRNSGIIGLAQLTGTMRKIGRKFKVIIGSLDDDRAYGKIKAFAQAVGAIGKIRESNIGVIGNVFRGMYDLELSKTFLKGAFDVNIIYIQSSHLLSLWQEVTEEEVKDVSDGLMKRFKAKNVTQDDIRRAVHLAIAMERLVDKFRLDAICFLDQHFVQKQVLTSARIGASLLLEKRGIMATCEGDLGGLVTMMLMHSISKSPVLMGEWGEYDAKLNSCLIMGHGIGEPSLAVNDEHVLLARTPEEWGFTGAGLNYELIARPGPATLAHIMETPGGYKLLVSPVESIHYPRLNYDELHTMVRVKQPVKKYMETILQSGVSHHCIFCLGNISESLIHVAELLGIELLFIE